MIHRMSPQHTFFNPYAFENLSPTFYCFSTLSHSVLLFLNKCISSPSLFTLVMKFWAGYTVVTKQFSLLRDVTDLITDARSMFDLYQLSDEDYHK